MVRFCLFSVLILWNIFFHFLFYIFEPIFTAFSVNTLTMSTLKVNAIKTSVIKPEVEFHSKLTSYVSFNFYLQCHQI